MDAERDYGGRRTTLLASVACEPLWESTEEREEVQLVSGVVEGLLRDGQQGADEFPTLSFPSSCSPSYTAWFGSTGREGCASILAPHSERSRSSGGGEKESNRIRCNGRIVWTWI